MTTPFQRCGCIAKTGEDITNNFIKQIEAGKVKPDHMAAVIYAMHNALMDRYESVALWIPTDLEHVADSVVEAIRCEENQPELEAVNVFRQCAEEGARQRFAMRGEA